MRNFVIICVDCLRYDCVTPESSFASSLAHTLPNANLFFQYAYSAAPWTYPATNSILTGRYPRNHGARHRTLYRERVSEPWPEPMAAAIPTLFSLFKPIGYYTLGISTIYWALNQRCPYNDIDKIVRTEDQNVFYKNTKAEWVFRNFLNAYDEEIHSAPFCAYLHLIDLHRPYDLELAQQHSMQPLEIVEGLDDWDIRPYLADAAQASGFRKNKVRAYHALVRYVDEQVATFVHALQDRGVLDDTTIIITSDHGDEFWDHYDFEQQHYLCGKKSNSEWWLLGTGHGHTQFNELARVPLVVMNWPPRVPLPQTQLPVSTVDILPTILDLAGVQNTWTMDGTSLVKPPGVRSLLMESTLYGFERKALVRGPWKCISSPGDSHVAFFDLANDPLERHPIEDVVDDEMLGQLVDLFSEEMQ